MESISTAPKDGTPILTDYGIVCYKVTARYRWQTSFEGWVCCDVDGYCPMDEHGDYREASPTMWTHLPEFKLPEEITKDNIKSLGFRPDGEETEFSFHIWDEDGPTEFHCETYAKEPLFELVWLACENKVFLEVSLDFNTLQAIVLPTMTFQELKTLVQLLTPKAL